LPDRQRDGPGPQAHRRSRGRPVGYGRGDPRRAGAAGFLRRAADGQGGRRGRDRHHGPGPGRGHPRDHQARGQQEGGRVDHVSPGESGSAGAFDDRLGAAPPGAPEATGEPAPVVAVVGRPNVGKSTLVNRILGSRQAVVADTPGVTRDRVAYDATWRGRAFTLLDTGGWEPSVEGSESLAARVAAQARVAVDAADAVLFG